MCLRMRMFIFCSSFQSERSQPRLREPTQLAVYGELKNIALSFQSEGSQPRLREPTQFAVYGELKNIALFGVRDDEHRSGKIACSHCGAGTLRAEKRRFRRKIEAFIQRRAVRLDCVCAQGGLDKLFRQRE
jgi:hypothetical protein